VTFQHGKDPRFGHKTLGPITLLEEDEQRLFRLFSTFMGGCTLDAAEVVLDGDGSGGTTSLDEAEMGFAFLLCANN